MGELLVIAGYVVCIGVLFWQRYLIIQTNKQAKEHYELMKAAYVVCRMEDDRLGLKNKEIDVLKKELSDLKEATRKI